MRTLPHQSPHGEVPSTNPLCIPPTFVATALPIAPHQQRSTGPKPLAACARGPEDEHKGNGGEGLAHSTQSCCSSQSILEENPSVPPPCPHDGPNGPLVLRWMPWQYSVPSSESRVITGAVDGSAWRRGRRHEEATGCISNSGHGGRHGVVAWSGGGGSCGALRAYLRARGVATNLVRRRRVVPKHLGRHFLAEQAAVTQGGRVHCEVAAGHDHPTCMPHVQWVAGIAAPSALW